MYEVYDTLVGRRVRKFTSLLGAYRAVQKLGAGRFIVNYL